ncbi:DUF724 domain-containing protein 2-like [Prunus avium]|uniref:DUF724 domain-containing protein 2-like n=1 Tax=Prunus avium TaxID=42229 RepID=A0A6P5T388_PRUAV|nr:DUF724 domain-containing protein 2-like [Prunus avium]
MGFPRAKAFKEGKRVEVCSREDGFQGSCYGATILQNIGDNKYKVKYNRLVCEDDHSIPLEEVVEGDEIRPLPPLPPPKKTKAGFADGDRVDAFDNDGWWSGIITGKVGCYFGVYFETGHHIGYPERMLRHHMDWRNGEWFFYH